MIYLSHRFFNWLASLLFLSCLLEKDYTAQIKHAVIGTAGIHSWYGAGFFSSVSVLASRIKEQFQADIVIHTKLYAEQKRKNLNSLKYKKWIFHNSIC